jgi:BirA family transcriptional regulator, biotin operon repressor / biotin---[acetyl-CoA-carboxylase] ligase
MNYNYESGAENLKQNLNCIHIGTNIVFLPKTDSTNNLAKEYAKNNAPQGLVIIADSQTCGRGRIGKSWYSPPKTGIYLSILLKPDLKTDQLSLITLVAGVSAIETINEFSHQCANLKWPNDILINGKKVCGLLCEMIQRENNSCFLVIGIGINVNQVAGQFPEGLKTTATSLQIINRSPINRLDVIQSLLKNIDREYHNFLTDGGHSVIKKWGLNTNLFGEVVSLKHGSTITTGTAMRIDSLGRLVLLLDNEHEEAFDSGEVSLNKN